MSFKRKTLEYIIIIMILPTNQTISYAKYQVGKRQNTAVHHINVSQDIQV